MITATQFEYPSQINLFCLVLQIFSSSLTTVRLISDCQHRLYPVHNSSNHSRYQGTKQSVGPFQKKGKTFWKMILTYRRGTWILSKMMTCIFLSSLFCSWLCFFYLSKMWSIPLDCWSFLLSSVTLFKVHRKLYLKTVITHPMLVCRRGWCMLSDVQLEYTAKISPWVILSRFCRNVFASSVQRCYDSLPDSLVCILSRVQLLTAS